MHANQRDVVDEAQVARAFLSFIIEKSCDTLDVLVFARLQGELLGAVSVDDSCRSDVFAVGVEHCQTDMQVDVIVIPAFLDEYGREGEDELVLTTETGVGMDGETLFVEQVFVAQREEFCGVPQVGGVTSCGKNCHHVVVAVDQLNFFIYSRVTFFQIAVYLVQLFGVAVVIDNGGVELCLSDVVLCKYRIDVILCFLFPLFGWQFIDDALHDVVIIQHIFHLAT